MRIAINSGEKEGNMSHPGQVTRKCEECGKEFEIPRAWLKRSYNAGKFCSRECMFKSLGIYLLVKRRE